ncbi:DUF6975 family protein [Sphingomonas sp. TDK1]|uniref:DUF6975 family protein n=1 Tax=Sphingomonas sp. TDK1 TaxID=453247 RepID=UPI0007D9101C|nr:hypothetical protein [Sphingomonas sp. TDK1]OAN62828.1 hypothetical protein A7X12_21315 [Sphingomonas sp. TDK1]
MLLDTAPIEHLSGAWGPMGALADTDGSARHPHLHQLRTGSLPLRDLADAVHHIARLHGRHPGLIDYAAAHGRRPVECDWLEAGAEAFVVERANLARLVAAAGPLPSTPGHAESEAAAAAQRHALDMLAQSDRAGCATGAALALAIDWVAIRAVLDRAAACFGLDPLPARLPIPEETVSVVDALAREAAHERAMLFGAQQVFAQHRGLWDLLEARTSARSRA